MTMQQGPDRREGSSVQRRRRSRRTKIRSGAGAGIMIMLAVVAAILLGITLFFKVNTIEVRGNSVYDAQTVIAASGLEQGDNLLAVSRAAVAARIEVALPYVEHVRITRVLPDTVVLEITESQSVFSVSSDTGEYWLMNFSGKLLETVTQEEAQSHPAITGFTVTAPEAGTKAVSASGDSLDATLTLLSSLQGTGLTDKFTRIDVSKSYDVVAWYGDQFEIQFGTTQEMEYKIKYLQAVLQELTQYQTGTIDLTFREEKVAKFMPW